jgi:hypothetical protein
MKHYHYNNHKEQHTQFIADIILKYARSKAADKAAQNM